MNKRQVAKCIGSDMSLIQGELCLIWTAEASKQQQQRAETKTCDGAGQ